MVYVMEEELNGRMLFVPIIKDKKQTCYFETEGEAIVYAGLVVSGLSKNDCNYLGRYLGAMIDGLKKEN